VRELLADDADPTLAVPRALTHLDNLLAGLEAPPAASPPSDSPSLGAACYFCATLYYPAQDTCPNCHQPSALTLPGPSSALLVAGTLIADRLQKYPGLPLTMAFPSPASCHPL